MNKAAVIGAVIIGITVVSAAITMNFSVEDTGSVSDEDVIEEETEVVQEGRDLNVEFDESISLKGP